MKKLLLTCITFLALAACNEEGPSFEVDDVGVGGDGNLGAVLAQIKTAYNVPAVGAMMLVGDSVLEVDVAGERVYGTTTRVTADDLWHLGSITKAMTATLAGKLVEEGVISWETTVEDVWGDDLSIRDEYKSVRLEELFYHTSGMIHDITRIPSWSGDRENIPDLPALRRQWAEELMNMEPEVVRGTFLYSNGGYIVAGSMLETVTGKQWETLLTEFVFDPLGMSESGFGAPGVGGNQEQPYGHYPDGNIWIGVEPGPFADNPPPLGPAGTVHSSLRGFAPYLQAHLRGAQGQDGLLRSSTFETLHTSTSGINYAMGWQTGSSDGNRILAHNGSNTIWFAEIRIEPDRDFAIMVTTNAGNEGGQRAVIRLMQAMVTRFEAMNN